MLANNRLVNLVIFIFLATAGQLMSQNILPGTEPEVFRGGVNSTVFYVPLDDIEGLGEVDDFSKEIEKYKIGESMDYAICNDSIYFRSIIDGSLSMEDFQLGNETLLYDSLYGGFSVFPKLRASTEGATAQDWVSYKRKRRNPFGFNYKFVNPTRREHVLYASVDRSEVYKDQYSNGGRFHNFLNPHGVYEYYGGIFNDTLVVQSFTYSYDVNYDCSELFSTAQVVRRVEGKIPENTLYYEPDTVVDLNTTSGNFELLDVFDSSGTIVSQVSLNSNFTYIEIYTDQDNSYTDQLSYLKELFYEEKINNVAITSVFVMDNDSPEEFLNSFQKRAAPWPHFMVPYGRSSYFGANLNLALLPRYIIVNSTGDIVLLNAPRPSDKRLLKVLQQLEKEK